jgi:PAS domain S-box-containing protein/putative nucleotidyltransferase with HDIG domain
MKSNDKTQPAQGAREKKPGVFTTGQLEEMQTKIQEAESRFQVIFDNSPDGMVILNPTENAEGPWLIEDCNRSFCEMNGFERSELIGKDIRVVSNETATEVELPNKYHEKITGGEGTVKTHRRSYYQRLKKGAIRVEEVHQRKDGSTFLVQASSCLVILGGQERVLGIDRDITEHKQNEEKLFASEMSYRRLFEAAQDGILILDANTGVIEDVNPFLLKMLGFLPDELRGEKIWDLGFFKDIAANKAKFLKLQQNKYVRYENLPLETKSGRQFDVQFVSNVYQVDHRKVIQCNIRDITDQKRAADAVRASEERYRSLFENSPISLWEEDFSAVKLFIEDLRKRGTTDFRTFFESHPEVVTKCMNQIRVVDVNKATLKMFAAKSKAEIGENLSVIIGKNREDMPEELVNIAEGNTDFEWQGINFTLAGEGRSVSMHWTAAPGYEDTLSKVLISMFDITERKQSEEALTRQTEELRRLNKELDQQLQQMISLREIDTAISSSVDIKLTLSILLDHLTKHLGIDAADVLLFNPILQTLKYTAGQGFRTQALQYTSLGLSDGFAGRAVSNRGVVTIQNLPKNSGGLQRSVEFSGEGFMTYIGVPLIAKGQVKGVLEILQRKELELDHAQQAFLEMLTGQAAIAIDSAQLFENLQSSNFELMMAYDETIEGWSQAMDLRDKETEGHSLRVVNLTLRLAASMGFGAKEMPHVRRGALLHDIGKIGVPDDILHKPGTLTEEEWVIMRKHPQVAHDMLVSINYLKPALDIPYCHHEKWDGTGYPRGLKGEQIPLAARIFAVVDVWDALSSDRPYRKAWPEDKIRQYIKKQSGKHFDPLVVKNFLNTEFQKKLTESIT